MTPMRNDARVALAIHGMLVAIDAPASWFKLPADDDSRGWMPVMAKSPDKLECPARRSSC